MAEQLQTNLGGSWLICNDVLIISELERIIIVSFHYHNKENSNRRVQGSGTLPIFGLLAHLLNISSARQSFAAEKT